MFMPYANNKAADQSAHPVEQIRRVFDDNYVPHRRGGGHIVFGADPVGVASALALALASASALA